ncbi:MAG: thiol reductase thioredoxin [Phycisphaerales bacterium]|nr:thiol reductase thioredoxin [Phycisphaerales bacterium]
MNAAWLKSKHGLGLAYDEYLKTSPSHAANWRRQGVGVALDGGDRQILSTFTRRMPVICISGLWCGDCAAQGPMLDAIARACPMVDLVFLDRDEHADLSNEVRIAGGNRVPTVLWMTEEFEFVHLLGDRTLTCYRRIAAAQIGASCPLPGALTPADEVSAVTGEWVREFERVQLILRLSPRLRALHGD